MEELQNIQEKTHEELVNIIHSLSHSALNYKQTIEQQQLHVSKCEQTIEQQQSYIATLQEQLNLSKLRHFGRKSEKNTANGQLELGLFDEAVEPDNIDEIVEADETITVPEHKRKKSGRKPLPKGLPRVQYVYDIPDEDKICPNGRVLKKIGENKTEQLDTIPAKTRIIEHITHVYACDNDCGCDCGIKSGTPPKQPIPRSIASPGLLAYVATSKYKDHLPLYRQEGIFQRMGVDIARNTLAHWMIKSSELLLPVYKFLGHNITAYDIAYADETTVQVLKEPGRAATSKSYMWCFIGGSPDKKSVVYRYDPGRAHGVIDDVLDDFSGYLHCDGYIAYDTYSQKRNVKLSGCWMHARRKFVEVTKTTKSEGIAHNAVKLIAKLYAVEKHVRIHNYDTDNIYHYRQKHAKPILDKIKQLLDDSINKVLPKSALGQAISYSIHQWPKLIRYIDDGRLEIDNGLSERAIKPFVIGRKNWMFSDSVAGVKAGQIIYSIIETCIAHKIEPYAYLRHVLAKLPAASSLADIEALMPYNIDKALLTLD